MNAPKYYAMQTLLGGLDVNRRTVYRDDGNCGVPICVFNQEMSQWDVGRQRELDVCLKALIEAAGKERV